MLHADGTSLDLIGSRNVLGHVAHAGNKWTFPHDALRKKRKRRKTTPSPLVTSCWKLEEEASPTKEDGPVLFHRVLVDAECTHDGSVRHIQKFGTQWGWDTFDRRVLNPERLRGLTQLQEDLLRTGLRHLRPGGFLVYATCSLCSEQNECVVEAALRTVPAASLAPLSLPPSVPCVPVPILGQSGAAFRFDPAQTGTSGLFMCRLTITSSDNSNGEEAASLDDAALQRIPGKD